MIDYERERSQKTVMNDRRSIGDHKIKFAEFFQHVPY